MNIKYTLTILLLFFATTIFSQDKYKVVYDYNNESINYFTIDKSNKIIDTLVKPKIKRSSLVEIELKNINPFAIDVVTDVKEEQAFISGNGLNFSSFLSGVKSFSDSKLGLNITNLPTDTIFNKANTRGESLSSDYSSFNDKSSNISALKTTFLANLLNPNLSKEEILNNIKSTAALERDARLPDPNENFYVYLTQLEKIVLEDKTELTIDINKIKKATELEVDNTIKTASRGDLIERNYLINDLQKLISSINESASITIENLNKIKSFYSTLEASSFTRTYDYQIDSDKINIELKFVTSGFATSLEDADNKQKTLKTRNIKLYAKGGFKINTGVALTLNNFGSNSQNFYIKDGIIGADSNDYLTPNLSTIINFYPYMGENFNIGGSFGLAIPISSDSDINGISFLLGPSMHFGSKSRLSLSGGLAYGPVKKLTKGLKVGDDAPTESIDAHTRNIYDFGYFFGISFNLFKLN
ncbi:hypothetical protein L3X39_14645 [Sabulilitoribacter multivorans]|uniref:Outer membrane protein beta-barrel domain-containing protein n=1 Tax=Flaviramulus multivorans TaxID=1304750 RepID=A0ABS9IMQ0_9FLAO|nr:hypothetical protein [Flaviramulus multivorans]MCF7561881.1 hypothetical protein [Flaviramulus multivorans]